MLSGLGPKQHLADLKVLCVYAVFTPLHCLSFRLDQSEEELRYLLFLCFVWLYDPKIPLVEDLPVGNNLQDHIQIDGAHFMVKRPVVTTSVIANSLESKIKYWLTGGGRVRNVCCYVNDINLITF